MLDALKKSPLLLACRFDCVSLVLRLDTLFARATEHMISAAQISTNTAIMMAQIIIPVLYLSSLQTHGVFVEWLPAYRFVNPNGFFVVVYGVIFVDSDATVCMVVFVFSDAFFCMVVFIFVDSAAIFSIVVILEYPGVYNSWFTDWLAMLNDEVTLVVSDQFKPKMLNVPLTSVKKALSCKPVE